MKRLAALVCVATTAVTACVQRPITPDDPTLEMATVLSAHKALGARPAEELSPQEARSQPSIDDAVWFLEHQRGLPRTRIAVPRVWNIAVSGADGPLSARLYAPPENAPDAPTILYFHGGGWIAGDVDAYDATARALADKTGAILVSVQFRQAPEAKFPAIHDDAVAAYEWLLEHAIELGGLKDKIALAGESAGANLAIDTAIAARDQGLTPPVHILAIYPMAGTSDDTPSMVQHAFAEPMGRAAARHSLDAYAPSDADRANPRLDIVGKADLKGLPPVSLVLARIDPLRSEGEALVEKLREAGVPVEGRVYPGMTHDFFGTSALIPEARAAQDFAAIRLGEAFGTLIAPPVPKPDGSAQPPAENASGLVTLTGAPASQASRLATVSR
ncbi:alpha/beta hydrolase [Marinivivus vitaminiproducens]|uniref:alpha/beta hydrolase n=1 Tax=Marinivivus vitaminiproducens TaxID=3035935 RepID=UPI00279E0370|nr:alpha/beta hydrolase [Geminicoccaceae bacterium SCSIO 64248]